MSSEQQTPATHHDEAQKPCLFAVHDNTRKTRRDRIEAIAELEPSIAFLAAVFDFEWMVRRAIVAVSSFPSPFIRKQMRWLHGPDGYLNGWDLFVCSGNTKKHPRLEAILHAGNGNVTAEWKYICDALKSRHLIVHGANGFIKNDDARKFMCLLFNASDILEDYLHKFKKTAFDRIDHRKWPDGERRRELAEKKAAKKQAKAKKAGGKK